jgi:hypothetical protein
MTTYRAPHPGLHQEEDAVPFRFVGPALLFVVVISAVLVTLAVSLTNGETAKLRPSMAFPEKWLGPRHRVARVREDVFGEHRGEASLDTTARVALGSYGWVDQARGVVRIPIDRAIDLVAEGREP